MGIFLLLIIAGIWFRFFGSDILSRNILMHYPLLKYSKAKQERLSNYLESFSYYRRLSEKGKMKFKKRLIVFILTRKFFGRNNLEITEEMKVLIGAAAIQLTFGLKSYNISNIKAINVFPKTFYSKWVNAELKGLTSAGGIISVSWKDFKSGYEDGFDNYNLGLHEMAHALKLSVLHAEYFDIQFADYLDRWEELTKTVFTRIKKGEKLFLRPYGGTNEHEFFAVCVEHFFENPEKFQKELPEVYNHLCILLKQNPINVFEDYSITTEFTDSVALSKYRLK